MSVNAETQPIVELVPSMELAAPDAAPAAEPAAPGYLAYERKQARPRPAWLAPLAVGGVGLIVAGMLGYVLYTTTQQRDAARHQLAATTTAFKTTRDQLTVAQTDAAAKKTVADYVSMYVTDSGKVQTDYFNVVNCADYSACRTSAQQLLTDMQQYQSDRSATAVPGALVSSDNSVGDALSAAIAGDQEFITGLDNDDASKIKDGGSKVDAAMLNLAKAESALGAELK